MVPVARSRYFELSVTDRVMGLVTEATGAAPHLVLELDAPLDRTRLGRAVDVLAEQHPILTCTVDVRAAGARWEPNTTAPVLVYADAPMETTALDARRGPTCRVVHEPSLAGTCRRLRFGLHHAVADGVGLLALVDDLRRLYRALRDNDHPPTHEPASVTRGIAPVNDASSGGPDVDWSPRTLSALLDAHRIGLGERARLAWGTGVRWSTVPRSGHGVPSGARSGEPNLAPWSCSGELVDHIVANGRDRGWRRSHVVVASLATAWSRTFGEEAAAAASVWLNSVNCRRQLGTTRGIGNLSGFEPVTLHDVAARALPEIVDETALAFTRFRELGAGMIAELGAPLVDVLPAAVLERAAETMFERRARESRWTRAVSVVDIPETLADWGDARALAGWCEPVRTMTGPSVAFVVTRFAGRVAFSPAASEAALGSDDADRLFVELDHVLAELDARVTVAP